jgi:hypothetical protein
LLFDRLAEAVLRQLDRASPMDMTTLLWAYAKAGHTHALVATLVTHTTRLLHAMCARRGHADFGPPNVVQSVWACATARHAAPELFEQAAHAVVPHLHAFNALELANLSWAYAMR